MVVSVIPVRIMDAIGDWGVCGGHGNGIQNLGGSRGPGMTDARSEHMIGLSRRVRCVINFTFLCDDRDHPQLQRPPSLSPSPRSCRT